MYDRRPWLRSSNRQREGYLGILILKSIQYFLFFFQIENNLRRFLLIVAISRQKEARIQDYMPYIYSYRMIIK